MIDSIDSSQQIDGGLPQSKSTLIFFVLNMFVPRCLTQTLDEVESEVGGILIALCCHHRCDWSPYVGKEFLTEQGP